jgi:hypothetical protein
MSSADDDRRASLRENGRRYREFMANLPDDEKTALDARGSRRRCPAGSRHRRR